MNYREAGLRVRHSLERSGVDELLRRLAAAAQPMAQHSRRVGDLALQLGSRLPDVPAPVVVSLSFSGHAHDVGKQHGSIVDLVNSTASLPDRDVQKLRAVHTREGARMLAGLIKSRTGYQDLLGTAAYVALHHHDDPQTLPEKVNASVERPMIAGLIHVVDMFDAMQDPGRAYIREPVGSPEEAAARIMDEVAVQPFYGIPPDTLMTALIEAAS